jgi:hypothetical protein
MIDMRLDIFTQLVFNVNDEKRSSGSKHQQKNGSAARSAVEPLFLG